MRNFGSKGAAEQPGTVFVLQGCDLFAQSYMIVEALSSGIWREPMSPGTGDVRFCLTLDQENPNQP